MQRDDYSVAKEIKETLSAFLDIVDYRVFGSRAREDHDAYSDMDVFIEVESLTGEQKECIYDVTWQAGFNHTLVISPIICTRVEIEQSPLRASPFLKNILSEGIRV